MAFKVDKTMQSAEKAIKGATRKAKDDLKKVEIKAEIKIIRKTCAPLLPHQLFRVRGARLRMI